MIVKYLIIRFSSIGDIVLTTPVIRGLKEQIEDSEIHYLTKKSFAGILQSNKYIDKVHILDDNFAQTITELKQENFNYIIDLHKNIRSFRVKRALRILDFTFDKINLKKYRAVKFKKIDILPNLHIVDRYMSTLSVFDVNNDNKGLDYFIPDNDTLFYNDLPENIRKGYIGFVIGAKHNTKKLPNNKIIEICKQVNYPIVLLGGKEDEEAGEIIAANSGSNVYNYCGKYNLNQSAYLVKNANIIISHDTGLMHIAAAFKKKIISVWGNTIPEFGMTPYMADEQSKIIEIKDLKCRPCSKIGYDKCPKNHFKCMNEIDTNKIVELVKELF